MSQAILEEIAKDQLADDRADFKVGDGVRVHLKVKEGDKTRIQIFAGIVISRRGGGIQEAFTVRRIASGVGVEKVFPCTQPVDRKKSRSTASRSPCVLVCFTCVIALVRPLTLLRKSASSKQGANKQYTITFQKGRPVRGGL